jgi:hypothetical protein
VANADHLLHSHLLAYGLVSWVTNGCSSVKPVNITQVDDMLLDDDVGTVALGVTTGITTECQVLTLRLWSAGRRQPPHFVALWVRLGWRSTVVRLALTRSPRRFNLRARSTG